MENAETARPAEGSRPRPMRVVQTVFGVFHHFDLGRQLKDRGHLQQIYSTWPWQRLKREGLGHEYVSTFPLFHTPSYLLGRTPLELDRVVRWLDERNVELFDRWTLGRLRALERKGQTPDALIALSGSSVAAGRWLQAQGSLFLCDRGSTHLLYQRNVVREEFERWGVAREVTHLRDTEREVESYRMADAITVPSQAAARSFVAMGIAAEKLHVIPYGVELGRFRPTGQAASDSFDVLFAGSVGLRKGVPYLLEAFASVRHPRKRLRIVGGVKPELADVLKRLPMGSVDILGVLPQAELAAMMSRSHALVLPSIEEGLALVQAQAMACGCPVIASVNTGSEDLFADGVEGFIVPIRDVEALADRMQRLADDPALQQRMRAAALERVKHMGGWDVYGARWERLLLSLTAGRSAV